MNEPNGLIGLRIDNVRPEDAGTYSLVVSNSLGETTGTAKVEVEEKEKRPEFVATLQPLNVVEGFPVKMVVKVLGKPPPQLQWFKHGEEVRLGTLSYRAILRDSRSFLKGFYSCRSYQMDSA